MKIDRQTLEKIAHLARLEVKEEEVERLLRDMSDMVSFVEKLKEVDTEGVEPLTTLSHEVNAFREDEVRNQLSKEEALKNAPSRSGDFFTVPRVLD